MVLESRSYSCNHWITGNTAYGHSVCLHLGALWLSTCLIHTQHMALQPCSCFDFLSPISSISLTTTEDETRTQVLSIKKVTAEDLKRNYVCHARNAKGEVDKPAKVKQKGNGCTQQMSL